MQHPGRCSIQVTSSADTGTAVITGTMGRAQGQAGSSLNVARCMQTMPVATTLTPASNTVQVPPQGCSLPGGCRQPNQHPHTNRKRTVTTVWCIASRQKGASGAPRHILTASMCAQALVAGSTHQALKAGGWKKGHEAFPALSSVMSAHSNCKTCTTAHRVQPLNHNTHTRITRCNAKHCKIHEFTRPSTWWRKPVQEVHMRGDKRAPQMWTAPVAVHTHPPGRTPPQESITSCSRSAPKCTAGCVRQCRANSENRLGGSCPAAQTHHAQPVCNQSLQNQARLHPQRVPAHTAIHADDQTTHA